MHGQHSCIVVSQEIFIFEQISLKKDSFTKNFKFFRQFEFSGQLQIKDAQESDQGKYECVAANDVGSQYSYSAQLYVRGKNFYKKFREIIRYFLGPKYLLFHSVEM